MGRSFDGSRAGCIARLIAEDFYRDGLDLASCNMGHQGERSADADDRLGRAPPGSRAGGQTWLGIPEVAAARTIRSSGADDRVVRRFLTFIGAMDRARNATQLWNAGLSLFLDSPQIFDPQHASGIDFDALQQLPRINRVSRKHRPDTRAWLGIAASLVDSRLSPVVPRQARLRSLRESRQESAFRSPTVRSAATQAVVSSPARRPRWHDGRAGSPPPPCLSG